MTTQATESPSVADLFRRRRVQVGTQKNYKGKLNTVKIFFLTNVERYGKYIGSDGELLPPLEPPDLEELFSFLIVNVDIPMRGRGRRRNTRRGREEGVENADHDDEDADYDDGDDNEEDREDHSSSPPSPPGENPTDRILALNKKTMSVSCMQGYKSAILWLYKEQL